jgi:hypothetical protein
VHSSILGMLQHQISWVLTIGILDSVGFGRFECRVDLAFEDLGFSLLHELC